VSTEAEAGSGTMAPARVLAVVVNHGADDVMVDCVRSLRAEGAGEVVVVDNGPDGDGEGRLARAGLEATYVRLSENRGYGAAVNRGVAGRGGDPVLVCNADVALRPGALAALVDTLSADPSLAVVGPRLVETDGTPYPSARTFPSLVDAAGHAFVGLVSRRNRFSRRYQMLDWDHRSRRPVDWVSGACFLIRRSSFDALGGFDESYFMYMEDVDLCWRAHRAGFGVCFEPGATVVHAQGTSTDRHPYRMILAHHRSLMRFARRSTRGWRRAGLPLVAAGLAVRVALMWARRAVEDRPRRSSRDGESPRSRPVSRAD
jgi:N-acetylglucosaminyl-diphospho-decaprenol L-rhamnosyltransferase